jgi:arylsulfatase
MCSCNARDGASHPNVLLIVVDTLRADHLGCYGYSRPTSPNLDALAARGTRFAAARAASSWTLPSVSSILTGLYPAVHGVERSDSVVSDSLSTLADDFHEAGYETVALSANPAFVTPRQGLARGFDRFDVLHGGAAAPKTMGAVPADASMSRWVFEASAAELTSAALAWLRSRDQARPFLLYLHYFDPHAAYSPPRDFARRFGVADDEPLAGPAQWPVLLAPSAPDAATLAVLQKLYDAEIAATDAAIGNLFDALPNATRDRTIVVVTADHGEEFGEHGGVQHGRTLYDELLRVPLLMAGPGVPAASVAAAPVSLAELRATIDAMCALAAPESAAIEPSFATALAGASSPGPVYADLEARFEGDRQQHRRAMVDGKWKLLMDPARGTRLFDLDADAGEHTPAGDDEAPRREAMTGTVLARDARTVAQRSIAPPRTGLLDPARREQLRALGYAQ